jgi:acyl-homoserine-lactone acylase
MSLPKKKTVTRCVATLAVLLLSPTFGAEKTTLDGVKAGQVLIVRDRWGVPHIYGRSMTALGFGAGYVQAEDHLDPMLKLFLLARGELSRVDGAPALAADVTERTMMHRELAVRNWNSTPHASRDYYQAFADGINRYVETHPQDKPAWYWKVDAQDIAAYLRYTVMRYSFRVAISKLGGGPATRPGEGSNAYAISGSRSATGHAMLHGDPHLPWAGENRLGYEMHLKGPEIDIAGTGFFGVPIPMIGHNADIAWTATNNAANTADVYEEKIDPQNPDRYLDSDGQWKTMEKRTLRFDVRQSDGSTKTVEKVARYTTRGPHLEFRGHSYSVAIGRWRDFPDPLTGSILRAKARNVDDFRAALAEYPLDKWNLIYADRQGNIFYVNNGVFPKRGPGFDFNKPVPGWAPGAQWNGYVDFRDLPQFTNPPNGVIVQCNNSPYSTAQPPVLDPAKFSPYLVHSSEMTNIAKSRAERAFEIFNLHPKVTWEDFRIAAFDLKILHAQPYLQMIIDASDGQTDPDMREVHSILTSWDGKATLDSRGLPILKHWERIAMAQLRRTGPPNREQSLAMLKQAIAEMKQLYGKVNVPLSEVQVYSHGKDYPVPGGDSLLNIQAGYKDGKWHANGGSSWMILVEFSTPLKALTIAPQGECDNPSSPHFADQTVLFSKQEMKPFPFSDADVENLAETRYQLDSGCCH